MSQRCNDSTIRSLHPLLSLHNLHAATAYLALSAMLSPVSSRSTVVQTRQVTRSSDVENTSYARQVRKDAGRV